MAGSDPTITTTPLLIRFRGICALIDRMYEEKRALLVRHKEGDTGLEHHIPFIEFYADDIKRFPGVKVVQYSRPGIEERLARIDLDPSSITEIRLKGLDAGKVTEEPNFQTDLPHMGKILGDDKASVVDESLLGEARDVDSKYATAFFDMPAGRILAGEPESTITRFSKDVGLTPRRFARWTDLHVQVPKGPVVLVMNNKTAKQELEVEFHETLRMLTIGNEPERMILGLLATTLGQQMTHGINHASTENPQASQVQPTGHFILYYDLLKKKQELPRLPIPSQINGRGCPNNVYP